MEIASIHDRLSRLVPAVGEGPAPAPADSALETNGELLALCPVTKAA